MLIAREYYNRVHYPNRNEKIFKTGRTSIWILSALSFLTSKVTQLKKYDPRVIVMNELGKDYSIEPLKVNLFKFITANNTCVVLRRILSTRLTHFELCKRNLLHNKEQELKLRQFGIWRRNCSVLYLVILSDRTKYEL